MSDFYLQWPNPDGTNGDFVPGPDGDILSCTGDTETVQRVLRLFLTNPRSQQPPYGYLSPDDIFNPTLGVGMRRTIGRAVNTASLQRVRQMARDALMQDAGVAKNPPPDATVTPNAVGMTVQASFTSATSKRPVATPIINLS